MKSITGLQKSFHKHLMRDYSYRTVSYMINAFEIRVNIPLLHFYYFVNSGSTQLRTKFILLINVKMSTIDGIFTFISMINTTPERIEARNFFIYPYFSFDERLKFRAQLS